MVNRLDGTIYVGGSTVPLSLLTIATQNQKWGVVPDIFSLLLIHLGRVLLGYYAVSQLTLADS